MASPALAATQSNRRSLAEAKGFADTLPDLLVEARRVATTILAGWHGRRRSGPGETFWQFRPFISGEPTTGIDWRRSARDDHVYIREREWEAAHTVWMGTDLSGSMSFRSRLAPVSKRERAVVLALAMAELLSGGGERVGLLGVTPPLLSRNAAEKIAEALFRAGPQAFPDPHPLRRFCDVVIFGDFLDPIDETEKRMSDIAATGARAHIVQILDPIEETFPFAGRTEFVDPETGVKHIVGRAEQYRSDYQARLAAHRDHLALICRRLDWTFLIHRTDRPATEPLLTLHARLSDRSEKPVVGPGANRERAA